MTIEAGTWGALDAALLSLESDDFGVLGPESIGCLCCSTCSHAALSDTHPGRSYVFYHYQTREDRHAEVDEDGYSPLYEDDHQVDAYLGWEIVSVDDLRHFIEVVRSYGFRVKFELDENLMPDPRTNIEVSSAPAFATVEGLA